jgi:hypothetical protein
MPVVVADLHMLAQADLVEQEDQELAEMELGPEARMPQVVVRTQEEAGVAICRE